MNLELTQSTEKLHEIKVLVDGEVILNEDMKEFDINDYKPEVLEDLQCRFAGMILSTNNLDNLQWAKEFMDKYEKKHNINRSKTT